MWHQLSHTSQPTTVWYVASLLKQKTILFLMKREVLPSEPNQHTISLYNCGNTTMGWSYERLSLFFLSLALAFCHLYQKTRKEKKKDHRMVGFRSKRWVFLLHSCTSCGCILKVHKPSACCLVIIWKHPIDTILTRELKLRVGFCNNNPFKLTINEWNLWCHLHIQVHISFLGPRWP